MAAVQTVQWFRHSGFNVGIKVDICALINSNTLDHLVEQWIKSFIPFTKSKTSLIHNACIPTDCK